MKKLIILIVRTFIISVILSKLGMYIITAAGINVTSRRAVETCLFAGLFTIEALIEMMLIKVPSVPSRKLDRILKYEGYTAEFYKVVQLWQKKCEKRGFGDMARLMMSELLIDGGYFREGFEMLKSVDYPELSKGQRQIYYNCYLYGAVLCGNKAEADKIYEAGKSALITVRSKGLSASVKHTLGCYSYLCGDLDRAEKYFLQAAGNAKSYEVLCESFLGLFTCYIETDRLAAAIDALKESGRNARNVVLAKKHKRAERVLYEYLAANEG